MRRTGLILPRRRVLLGGAAVLATPSIVRAGSLSLLGVGGPSGGAPPTTPAYVQGAINQNGAGSSATVPVSFSNPVGLGHAVIVSIGWATAGVTLDSVYDDASNVYTILSGGGLAGGYWWKCAYLTNAAGSPSTVTAEFSSGAIYVTVVVAEFENVLGTGAIDGSSFNLNQAGTNTTDGITSGAFTTAAAGDLIYGSCVNIGGNAGLSVGTSFTGAAGASAAPDFVSEYLVQPSAGSIAATFTGSTLDHFSTFAVALKHA